VRLAIQLSSRKISDRSRVSLE